MKVSERMRRCVCAGCALNRWHSWLLRVHKRGGGWSRKRKIVRKLFRLRTNPAACRSLRRITLWERIKAAARKLAKKRRNQ